MAKTGPQRYPGASTAYWYQTRFGGSAMEANVGVIHTTEGTSVPGYGGGASAPNFTALPDIGRKRLIWYQHFDFDVSSRALVNLAGGVETNTLNAVQVELVGTCDPRYRTSWGTRRAGVDYLYWPEAPDWALAELARFVRWAHAEHGLRLESSVTWRPYPSSYGPHAARLSGAQWTRYYGWLGHQHVPENSHGDPGNLNFARVLEHAKGTTTKEDDVALTDDDIKRIWAWRLEKWDGEGTWAAGAFPPGAIRVSKRVEALCRALAAEVGAVRGELAALAAGGGLDAAEIEAAAAAGAEAFAQRLGEVLADTREED